MKAVVLLLMSLVSLTAQTNTITFTNKSGEVIRNAEVLTIRADDLFYKTPSGGARVSFSDLPPEVSARFGWRRWPLPASPITGAFGYTLGEPLPDTIKPVQFYGHLSHADTNATFAPFRYVWIAALPDRRVYNIRAGTFSPLDRASQTNAIHRDYLDEERKHRADVDAVKNSIERQFGPCGQPEKDIFSGSTYQWRDGNRSAQLEINDSGTDVTVEYRDLQLFAEAEEFGEKVRSENPPIPKHPISGAFGYTLGEKLPSTLSPDEISDLSISGSASTNPPFVNVSVSTSHSGIYSIEATAPISDENYSAIRDEIERTYGPGSWITNWQGSYLKWGDTNRCISLERYPWQITVGYLDRRLGQEAIKESKKERTLRVAAEQQQQAAVALQEWREREAVKKTAVKISGQILQVVAAGVLFKIYAGVSLRGGYAQTDIDRIPELYGNDHVLCLIQDLKTTGLTDDQWFGNSTVYPIGTYQYTTVAGGSKTIRKFTVSLARAIEWRRNNPGR